MKYEYNSSLECFEREDKLGKKFYINSNEAQRIVTMRELGYSIGRICAKIQFNSDKVYESTVANFLKNVDEGNIIVNGDYPAPKGVIKELTVSDRLVSLEDRVTELEEIINIEKSSWIDKVKSWKRQVRL